MILSDEQLLSLNNKGWIPGPEETEEEFCKRIQISEEFYYDPKKFFEKKKEVPPFPLEKKVLKPRWSWPSSYLFDLFDFAPDSFCAFFHNQELSFLRGATTWILEVDNIPLSVIQVREQLIKGSFLKIYSLEEILTHEAVHAARVAFPESQFEEFFAYSTSPSIFRKFFGPIAASERMVLFLVVSFSLSFFFQWLFFFLQSCYCSFFSLLFDYGFVGLLVFSLFRLTRKQWIFRKTYKKLFSILKNKRKAMATLFRLTDGEIEKFSRSSFQEIIDFVQKEKSLRYRLLRCAYFT